MKIMTTEVPYIGHVLISNGLNPDPKKVHAVEGMPSPAGKPALLRFLGMVNYMSKFIPNLADLTQPLRELLHKEVEWHWSKRQEKTFQAIKEKLTSDAALHYYDVEKLTTVSALRCIILWSWGMSTARGSTSVLCIQITQLC